MSERTLWTVQHQSVLRTLELTGRYTAARENSALDLEEHAPLMREAFDWLVQNAPDAASRPPDAEYPIWVAFSRESAMRPDPDAVLLELVTDTPVTRVNINKWGTILNYSYIPADAEDAARHRAQLEARGLSDTQAYMSRFYPQLKREIRQSWSRLFDDSVLLGSDAAYGVVWELRREWVAQVIGGENE